jgi:hypothetical membrane protein
MTPGNLRSSTSSRASAGRVIVFGAVGPVALIGGWTLAASLQPRGYNWVSQTISALAAHGAHDRVVMTVGLAVLGASYLVTAVGLRPAARVGRWALAIGGVATIAVAGFPQPAQGSSARHVLSATIGFVALALWPALAGRGGAGWGTLSRRTSIGASVVLSVLLCWFGLALGGDQVGVAERCLAGAESLWPLVVVVSNCRRSAPR